MLPVVPVVLSGPEESMVSPREESSPPMFDVELSTSPVEPD